MSALEVQANRFELVSRLADDLAHEIKNPLHAIVINLELLKRRAHTGDVAAVLQRAEFVGAELIRVNELLDQLLQLLRPMRQGDRVRDVDATVGELLPLLVLQARLSRVELVYHPLGEAVAAPIRRDVLKLVLLNLVVGALEEVRPAGGRIEVAASVRDGALRVGVRGIPPPPAAGPVPDVSPPRRAPLALDVARHLLEEVGAALEVHPGDAAGELYLVRFPPGTAA